jgi:hypothetical protein
MKKVAKVADAIINMILGEDTPVSIDFVPVIGRSPVHY